MKLLVGYDGSNSAKEALSLAIKHAKAFSASLTIVTSMETSKGEDADEIVNAKKELEYAESQAANQGVQAESHLLIRGMEPGDDLVKFSVENKVDTIFIGVKRRSKVGKLLFGSNAQYIICKASCPVMTVR
jgi:nucleotide-binding universal stress UspA family protein